MTIPPCANYCTLWNPKGSNRKPVKVLISYCTACTNYPIPKPEPKRRPT